MTAPPKKSLEQDGLPQDPLEIAASYDGMRFRDWKLIESRNGLSVFAGITRTLCVLILLCYDQRDLERECAVVSPTGMELLRVVGRRVRPLNEDFAFAPVFLVNKVDRFIDCTLELVKRAEEGAH